jgi:hypothetical protein
MAIKQFNINNTSMRFDYEKEERDSVMTEKEQIVKSRFGDFVYFIGWNTGE